MAVFLEAKMKRLRRTVALAALATVLTTPAMGWSQPTAHTTKEQAAKADRQDGQGGCFYINQLQGNHALNDRSVIFRANVSDFYRLDFAQRCYALTYPQPVLILTPVGGIGLVCHAIDLDVKVGEQGPGSIPEPCIPTSLHKLTPPEVAAIPKKDLP